MYLILDEQMRQVKDAVQMGKQITSLENFVASRDFGVAGHFGLAPLAGSETNHK
jgi:hypothetical protein